MGHVQYAQNYVSKSDRELTQDLIWEWHSEDFGIGTCFHVCTMYEIHNLKKKYISKISILK